MYEVISSLPGDQGDRLAGALVRYGFTGEQPEPSTEAWYFAFLAFRGRIELSAKRSHNGTKGSDARWGDASDAGEVDAEREEATGGKACEAGQDAPSEASGDLPSQNGDGKREVCHNETAMANGGWPCADCDAEYESESEKESEMEKRKRARERAAAREFVGHLNEVCGTRFRPNSESTVSLVRARLREGYTTADLCAVVDAKFREWGSRPDMRRYLRPETLLRASKFEGYLQEARSERGRASPFADYDVEPSLVIGGEQ